MKPPIALLTLLTFAPGCATPQTFNLPQLQRVEDEKLHEHPKEKYKGAVEWVAALEEGDTADKPGIFMSEAKARRLGETAIRYDELRTSLEANNDVWRMHRLFYEEELLRHKQELAKTQTWWQRNKTEVAFAAGIVTTVLVFAGGAALAEAVTSDN